MMEYLRRYRFSKRVTQRAEPIAESLRLGPVEAERALAKLALDLCDEIESGRTTAREADEVFTLIDLFLEDNRESPFGSDARELLLEGMSLHHLGEDSGADLPTIRRIARKLML